MSYIFKASTSTKEGFSVKLMAEILNNVLKYPPFCINERGIFLRAPDPNKEILIDLSMNKEDFIVYKCPKPLYFIVNSSHFYKLLKTIKKKDSVTLFINEKSPMQLGVSVCTNDENSEKVTTFININYTQPEEFDLPSGYNEPIIVTSKNFQKLKTLHNIGTDMSLTIFKNSLKFFCNGKNLYQREVKITVGDDEDKDDSVCYSQTYTTQHITQLTKCAGQSGNVLFYHDENSPLQIKMQTGSLVKMKIFIKSKELIETEQEDENEDKEDNIISIENNGQNSKDESTYDDDDQDEQDDQDEDDQRDEEEEYDDEEEDSNSQSSSNIKKGKFKKNNKTYKKK